jgi:DHA2 family multidrug resistance protein-like MFS transporter
MTRAWLALGVLSLGVLVIGVDGTVLAVATPLITKNLESTATQVLWIGDIYSFVLAGLLVTMGVLGDRIGHKKLLLCSATAFAGVSVATAYAPTAELLIGARALLGVAGAALAPSTLALIRGLFPRPRERSMAVGVWAAMFSAGTALGPVIGGLLLEHFWWGSVFLINVPVMVVLLVGGIILLPEQRDPTPGPFDLPSVGLSLVGMLGLVYAVKEGAANGLRVDITMVGVVGAAALTLFVRRQITLPAPLIDVRLFGNRAFSGVVAANLLSVLGLSGLVFFLSQFFQLVQGYNPLRAGLAELPAAVAATVFGMLAGVAVRYWSQRAVLATGLALVGVAMASLTLISPATGYPQLGIALFVVGVGLGLAFTAASDIIIASVMPERAGAAAAVSETAYELDTRLYHHRRIPRAGDSARHPGCRGGACARFARGCDRGGNKPARRHGTRPADRGQDRLHRRAGHRGGGRLGAAAGIGASRVAAAQAPPDGTTRSAGSGGTLCSKLNTLLGSYFALIVRSRSTLGPQ